MTKKYITKDEIRGMMEELGYRKPARERRPRIRPGILPPDLVDHGIRYGWWDVNLYLPSDEFPIVPDDGV